MAPSAFRIVPRLVVRPFSVRRGRRVWRFNMRCGGWSRCLNVLRRGRSRCLHAGRSRRCRTGSLLLQLLALYVLSLLLALHVPLLALHVYLLLLTL